MGTTFSNNVAVSKAQVFDDVYASCGKVSSVNVSKIDGFKLVSPPYCGKDSGATFSQISKVNTKCVLSNLQKQFGETASKIDSKTDTGLGISISNNIQDNVTKLTAHIKDTCPDSMASNSVDWKNFDITTCNFSVPQFSNAQQVCEINTAQNALSKIIDKTNSSTTGFKLGFLGSMGLIVGIIIVVLVLAFIFIPSDKKKCKSGTNCDNENSDGTDDTDDVEMTGGSGFNYVNIAIICLALLSVIFMFKSSHSICKKNINEFKKEKNIKTNRNTNTNTNNNIMLDHMNMNSTGCTDITGNYINETFKLPLDQSPNNIFFY